MIDFLVCLIIQYNTTLVQAVLHCILEGMMDEQANQYLLPFVLKWQSLILSSKVKKETPFSGLGTQTEIGLRKRWRESGSWCARWI